MKTEVKKHPLGKAALTGVSARRFVTKSLPWDPSQTITVRSLTEIEQSKFEAGLLQKKSGQIETNGDSLMVARRQYVALCLVDEDGQPLLTAEDIDAMANADARLINFCNKVAQDHNGVEENEIETLVGN